ncbi:MAG: sigma-70 family RNA polymerase sigma factor [Burkholderiaceae bacterium]
MAELYVQCRAKVFRQVACFIHDPPLAHDVTQEVFLRIWRYAASYDPAKSIHAQAWINQAARNQVMTELARRRRRREDPEEAVEDKADEHAEPRQMARVVVQSPVFSAAMNTLAPATRKVILMRYFQDLSLQEIATELQLPLGTVKTWLHRGLARMKVQLDMQRS